MNTKHKGLHSVNAVQITSLHRTSSSSSSTAAVLKLQPFNHKTFNSFVASSSNCRLFIMAGEPSVSFKWLFLQLNPRTNVLLTTNRLKLKFKLLISSLSYFSSHTHKRLDFCLVQKHGCYREEASVKNPELTPPSSPASRKPRLRRLFFVNDKASGVKTGETTELNQCWRWNRNTLKASVDVTRDDELPENQINWIPAHVQEKETGPDAGPAATPISPPDLRCSTERNTEHNRWKHEQQLLQLHLSIVFRRMLRLRAIGNLQTLRWVYRRHLKAAQEAREKWSAALTLT